MDLRPPDPPLTDGVVRLRLERESDVPAMVEHCREAEMQRWTTVPGPYGEQDARDWLELSREQWRSGEGATFAIADAVTDEYFGGITLRSGPWPVADVGYGLRAAVRGRGLTPRALRLVADWAFGQLGLVRIELVTDADNRASQRVAEKAGFTREGVLRQRLEVKGRRSDCVMFSLLPTDPR